MSLTKRRTRKIRTPRYLVGSEFPIIAYFSNKKWSEYKLKTLSLNGCGIDIGFQDARALNSDNVDLNFKWGNRRLKLNAKAKYCIHKEGTNFLGIEFEAQSDKLETFLKILMEKGLVERQLATQQSQRRKKLIRKKKTI